MDHFFLARHFANNLQKHQASDPTLRVTPYSLNGQLSKSQPAM